MMKVLSIHIDSAALDQDRQYVNGTFKGSYYNLSSFINIDIFIGYKLQLEFLI